MGASRCEDLLTRISREELVHAGGCRSEVYDSSKSWHWPTAMGDCCADGPAPVIDAFTTRRDAEKHGLAEATLSSVQVVVYLVTAIIGCGVVVLPSLMRITGWLLTPLVSALTSLAFIEIVQVLDGAIVVAEKSSKAISSFEDIGRAALDGVGVALTRSITGTGFFGTLIVYTILISQNVRCLLLIVFDGISFQFVMISVSPMLLWLATMKDGTLAAIMPIGMLASLSSCALICVKGVLDADAWQRCPLEAQGAVHDNWPQEPSCFGTVLAVLFSAYSVVGTVPSIRGQMTNTKDFVPAFRVAIAIVFLVYMAVMFAGYWGYGNMVDNNVVHSMMSPPTFPCNRHGTRSGHEVAQNNGSASCIGVIMALLVSTYLLLGFSLFFKCIAGMMQNLGDPEKHEVFRKDSPANRLLRAAVVVVVALIGLFVPDFRDLMAVVSSVCCSCNNVFFPLLFAYKLGEPGSTTSLQRRVLHGCILLLGVFCLTLGLSSSIPNLVAHLRRSSDTGSNSRHHLSGLASNDTKD